MSTSRALDGESPNWSHYLNKFKSYKLKIGSVLNVISLSGLPAVLGGSSLYEKPTLLHTNYSTTSSIMFAGQEFLSELSLIVTTQVKYPNPHRLGQRCERTQHGRRWKAVPQDEGDVRRPSAFSFHVLIQMTQYYLSRFLRARNVKQNILRRKRDFTDLVKIIQTPLSDSNTLPSTEQQQEFFISCHYLSEI